MVECISTWAKNIAIAVIISTLIMMILPDNKNKKYIKVIVGIYILFCVISPVSSKVINIDDYDIGNYVKVNDETNQNKNYISTVNEEFENKMIENIKEELKNIGFKSDNVSIKFDKDYNLIEIKISNVKKYKKINKIEITTKDNNEKISGLEEQKIKENFSKKYSIDKNKIFIN